MPGILEVLPEGPAFARLREGTGRLQARLGSGMEVRFIRVAESGQLEPMVRRAGAATVVFEVGPGDVGSHRWEECLFGAMSGGVGEAFLRVMPADLDPRLGVLVRRLFEEIASDPSLDTMAGWIGCQHETLRKRLRSPSASRSCGGARPQGSR